MKRRRSRSNPSASDVAGFVAALALPLAAVVVNRAREGRDIVTGAPPKGSTDLLPARFDPAAYGGTAAAGALVSGIASSVDGRWLRPGFWRGAFVGSLLAFGAAAAVRAASAPS